MKNKDLTHNIIACAYEVFSDLGYGFLESVYQNALDIELRNCGLNFKRETQLQVLYQEQPVGFFRADFLIENRVIVEVKAGANFHESAIYQTLNYLRMTKLETGLVVHFGPKPVIKRVINDV